MGAADLALAGIPVLNVLHLFISGCGLGFTNMKKFEAVGSLRDLEQLRALASEAVDLARRMESERDEWKRRYELLTDDMVSIPEVTLDDLARMVRKA